MFKLKSFRSLRVTLALLALLGPLVAVLAVFSYVEYSSYRRLMLENLDLTAANSGRIIKGSLQHAMQVNDFSTLRQIIADIAQQPDVQNLMLLDKEGRVLLAADETMTGSRIDIADSTCQACHRNEVATSNASVLLVDRHGQTFLRHVSTLENTAGCQSCHGPAEPILGVLISDFSIVPIEKQLGDYSRSRLAWFLGSILLTLLFAGFIVDRTIITRLQRFTKAIRGVTEGNLEIRVQAGAPDELGMLADAFNRMADGLKEKQALEQSLAEQTDALRAKEVLQRQLLERLITAQEEERKRIARELHDQTGQALSSLIMTLEVLSQSDGPNSPERMRDLRDLIAQILDQVHDLALELRPSMLDDLGLLAAIRHCLRGYQDRFHLPVEFQAVGLDRQRLPPQVETALYRIMQEALANIIRHAEAHGVSVLLEYRGRSVVLIVEDDGKGFDVAEVMGSRLHAGNLGLHGMQERASLVAGTLTIESAPGRGTTVYAEIPVGAGERP